MKHQKLTLQLSPRFRTRVSCRWHLRVRSRLHPQRASRRGKRGEHCWVAGGAWDVITGIDHGCSNVREAWKVAGRGHALHYRCTAVRGIPTATPKAPAAPCSFVGGIARSPRNRCARRAGLAGLVCCLVVGGVDARCLVCVASTRAAPGCIGDASGGGGVARAGATIVAASGHQVIPHDKV